MLKPLHISLVIAVTALTVLATGTVLRDANGHSLATTGGVLQRTWKSMTDVFASTAAKPAVPTTTKPDDSSPFPTTASAGVLNQQTEGTPVSASDTAGWSKDDLNRLATIGTQFASSMTPSDWSLLAKDFGLTGTVTSNTEVDSDVIRILQQHLSASDLEWIQQHFQGRQAFDVQDVQLLQGALSQMEQQLTPDELAMVEDGLKQWLSANIPN